MRYQGKITSWKDDRGFGFITPNGGGSQVFVHVNAIANRRRRPVGNEMVTYEVRTNAKGQKQAVSVAFSDGRASAPSSHRYSMSPLILAVAILLFVAGSSLAGKLPLAVLGIYLVASAVAVVAYAIDKSAAQNNKWRIQESTLHLFALIGGWPGALAAQRLFRHKTRKKSFQTVFWMTVVLNCGALGWLISPSGAKTLHSILDAV